MAAAALRPPFLGGNLAKAEEEGKEEEEEEDAIEARQKMESGGIAEMGEMLLVVQCPGCKITLPPPPFPRSPKERGAFQVFSRFVQYNTKTTNTG